MKNILYLLFTISFFCSFSSCQEEELQKQELTREELEELIIKSQRHHIKVEDKMMDDYTLKYNWESVQISKTGIRYWIYKRGTGKSLSEYREQTSVSALAVISYESTLLDSTSCYSFSADKPFVFVVGGSEAVSGLHEIVEYLNEGDAVKAVFPARLAYGLSGDQKIVPPNSPLVYNIELLQWK